MLYGRHPKRMLPVCFSSMRVTLGNGIHTTFSNAEYPNWEFPTHPDMRIIAIR